MGKSFSASPVQKSARLTFLEGRGVTGANGEESKGGGGPLVLGLRDTGPAAPRHMRRTGPKTMGVSG